MPKDIKKKMTKENRELYITGGILVQFSIFVDPTSLVTCIIHLNRGP